MDTFKILIFEHGSDELNQLLKTVQPNLAGSLYRVLDDERTPFNDLRSHMKVRSGTPPKWVFKIYQGDFENVPEQFWKS